LPVTGEWIMLMVPFGGLLTLAGILLLLLNRRKQHVK
jgi:LPXTG-motif cell wall-anchored protein